jgi:hypothetical protein
MSVNARRTPYDDNYATCERTCAKLLIYPGSTDPDKVTEELGIEPTQVNKKGATWRTGTGRIKTYPLNAWFLSSEAWVDSKDLRRHLDWLLDKLVDAQTGLRKLQSMPEMKMTVDCVWWSAHGHGGPTLWPEQMKVMAELGLECGFDVYFFGNEDDE